MEHYYAKQLEELQDKIDFIKSTVSLMSEHDDLYEKDHAIREVFRRQIEAYAEELLKWVK